ncbi:iron-containing alcohol dehydrogenase [Moorellaceae bacterium AZ2]
MVSYITRTSPILFGVGAIEQVGERVKGLGCKKVMLVTDGGLKSAGVVDEVVKHLTSAGLGVVQYDKVPSDAPDYAIEEGASIARAEGVDGIVGVGGGSVLDTAKAVNVLLTNPPPITDYYGVNVGKNPGKVLVLAPTTSGTGSEVTAISVVSDSRNNKKGGVIGHYCTATLAIVDPALTVKLPPALTAGTGMDAFSHAAEALTSGFANPISDIFAERAIQLITKYLPIAVENGSDITARTNMALASLIAGIAFNDALPHFGHAIAHTMGARFHVHHGTACALAIAPVIAHVAALLPDKVRIIGRAMGLDLKDDMPAEELGQQVAAAIKSFSAKVGIPGLKQLNLEKSAVEGIAADVPTDDCANFGPEKMTVETAAKLLQAME